MDESQHLRGDLRLRAEPVRARLRGRARRYYSLTAKGRARLKNLTVYWKALRAGLDDLLAGKG